MSIKRGELNNKWWFRLLEVFFWLGVVVNAVIVLGIALSVLIEEDSFFGAMSVLAGGALIVLILSRLIAIIFIYIASGPSEVGLRSGEGKLLLLPPKNNPVLFWLIGITVVSGFVTAAQVQFDYANTNKEYVAPTNTQVRKLATVGSDPFEEEGVLFELAEITGLGRVVSNDFGYDSWDKKETSGSFSKVVLTLTNKGNVSKAIEIGNLRLRDQDGRNYSVDRYFTCDRPYTGSYSIPLYSYTWTTVTLKPNVPCRVSALFEVSKESQSFYMDISWSR